MRDGGAPSSVLFGSLGADLVVGVVVDSEDSRGGSERTFGAIVGTAGRAGFLDLGCQSIIRSMRDPSCTKPCKPRSKLVSRRQMCDDNRLDLRIEDEQPP